MRVSSTILAVAGMSVAGAAMIAVPAVEAVTDASGPASPSAATSASPSPVPTVTVEPNIVTAKAALKSGTQAYALAVEKAGGVTVDMFTANGYASVAKMAPNGNMSVATGAKALPQVRQVKKQTYVQLGGSELTGSQALRTKAGKPTASWTTSTAALAPTLNLWLTPVNLASDVAGLSPGLRLTKHARQPDGTVVITSDLYPERIKDSAIRAAFRLPSAKKPTQPGRYRVDFGLDAAGVLTRIVVTTKGTPVQVAVTAFEKVAVASPSESATITKADIEKATKVVPAPPAQ